MAGNDNKPGKPVAGPTSEEVPAEPLAVQSRELIATYRYLRLGIVSAVVMILTALFFELVRTGVDGDMCLRGSMSAYFYSPARSPFVAGLFAIGVCLIVLQGHDWREEIALNLAGMFAGVVAFVPTVPSNACNDLVTTPRLPSGEIDDMPSWTVKLIQNNISSYMIAGGLTLAFAVIMSRKRSGGATPDDETVDKNRAAFGAYAILLVVGFVLLITFDDGKTWSHLLSAGAMFLCFGYVVQIYGWKESMPAYSAKYAKAYRTILWFMISWGAICLIVWALIEATDKKRHWLGDFEFPDLKPVFFVELGEIIAFGVFWILQTSQRWNFEPSTPKLVATT
jgi:hypothetical protein